MSVSEGLPKNAHVIVLGNEKGGSGKTTTAMHLIVALLNRGKTVGSIDIDSRQQSLTRYINNRRQWSERSEREVPMPDHRTIVLGPEGHLRKDEDAEFAAFAEAIGTLEHTCDFLIVDSPGSDTYLSRLGHSMADTLVTPINDSFLDLDVLASVDVDTLEFRNVSQYADMVHQSRRRRNVVDEGRVDWVVVRNRLSPLQSHNAARIEHAVNDLSSRLEFRVAPGVSERVVFRELFPAGLTLFDVGEDTTELSVSHLAARKEVQTLLDTLELPYHHRVESRPFPPGAAVAQ